MCAPANEPAMAGRSKGHKRLQGILQLQTCTGVCRAFAQPRCQRTSFIMRAWGVVGTVIPHHVHTATATAQNKEKSLLSQWGQSLPAKYQKCNLGQVPYSAELERPPNLGLVDVCLTAPGFWASDHRARDLRCLETAWEVRARLVQD